MEAKRIDGQAVNGKRQRLADVLPLDTPYAITIFPIYACNFKCKYCIHSLPLEKRDELSDCVSMDFNLYKKCIDDIKKFPNKLKVLHFIGYGEPLLHKNIVEMVEYAVQQNVAESVDIVTNGALLSREISDGLVKAGLTRLRISLQGLSDEAYKTRAGVSLSFRKFYDNVKYFYEHKQAVQLHIKIIDIGLSQAEKEEFSRLFSPIADTIAVENLVPVVDQIDYQKAKNEPNEKGFHATLAGAEVSSIDICPQVFYFMQINPDGKCVPCCSTKIPIYVGNVHESTVIDIWNGKVLHCFQQMQIRKFKNKNSVCASCTQYKFSVFPEDILDDDAEKISKRCYT